ncbi:MAG: PhoH family protein [Terriglobales bacterium]
MKTSIEFGTGIQALFGPLDENLRLLENQLQVSVHVGPASLEVEGEPEGVERLEDIVRDFQQLRAEGQTFANGDLRALLRVVLEDPGGSLASLARSGRQRAFGKKVVQPKGLNQRRYLDAIERQDMVFGVGPAGTGKTYLAVAMAVAALNAKQVERIILARPAVEAGERLGFLPGTLQEKIDPYLRPLYDAMFDLVEPERIERLLERNVIEIAPLAFMRGRTLNDAFIILDEAQNSTQEQMKMFLTRVGYRSKAVITGDITQIDLPAGRRSGLLQAIALLGAIEGIAVTYFDERDVVRHPLVQRIVHAYQEHEARANEASRQLSLLPEPAPEPKVPPAH